MKRLTGQMATFFAIIMVQTPPHAEYLPEQQQQLGLFNPLSPLHCWQRNPSSAVHLQERPRAGSTLQTTCQPMLSPKPQVCSHALTSLTARVARAAWSTGPKASTLSHSTGQSA